MLELLPQENKKKIFTEYIFRVSNVALLFLLASQILLLFLFTPSFFWTKYRDENLISQLSGVSFGADSKDNPTNLIHTVNDLTKALSDGKSLSLSSNDAVQKVLAFKGKGIKIYSFNVNRIDASSMNFSISGIADTRNDLIGFQSALKQGVGFQNVVLPVANIIKNVDADFTITFTMKK